MKKLLLFITTLMFTISIKAQNCSYLIESKYDEMTDIKVIRMKGNMYINDDSGQRKVAIFVAQKIEDGTEETVLTFNIKNGGCINNQNGIIFLFTDGTRLKVLNHGAYNCEGFAMLNIGIPDYDGNTIKSYLEQKR